MAAVLGSDLIVLVPWLAFGVALIIFYFWLRRPARLDAAPPRPPYVPPPSTADADPEPTTHGRGATCTGGCGDKRPANLDRHGKSAPRTQKPPPRPGRT